MYQRSFIRARQYLRILLLSEVYKVWDVLIDAGGDVAEM